MLQRKFICVTTDPRMQGPFISPFKVLRDLFHNPPFVADPEFTPFDIGALRCKLTRPSQDTPPSCCFTVDQAKLVFWVWFIELVVAPKLGLIILEALIG
jgi:hypothetical protein